MSATARSDADSYIVGRLDVTTVADLRAYFSAVLEPVGGSPDVAVGDLVVDLSAVDAVDMVGLGLLVSVHRQAGRQGRRLVLARVPPRVMRLLVATRLRRVLAIRELPRSRRAVVTIDDAAADFSRAEVG